MLPPGGGSFFFFAVASPELSSPGPGHRGDLPDTFGQLSYPKLTSSRFHLLLPRIGDRHRGRHIGTLSGVGWQIVDLQQISQSSVKSIIMHATVGAVTRRLSAGFHELFRSLAPSRRRGKLSTRR